MGYTEPLKPIYDVRDRAGRTKHIIGSEKDRHLIMGYALVRALREMTPADIQEGISDLSKGFRKENRKTDRARKIVGHFRNAGYTNEDLLGLGEDRMFGLNSDMVRDILEAGE